MCSFQQTKGFKKEDFRVQVDDAGRLTVRGQRPTGAGADGKLIRFHKVFQLPSTANLDEISGRFHDNVLILTVPKRPATAPTTIQEIKKPPMPKEEDAKPKDDEASQKTTDTMPPKEEDAKPKEEIPKKALDDASKVQHKEEEAAAKKRKQEQEQKPTPAVRKEEVMKPKTEATAATTENQAKPEAAGERAKSFDRESLAERTRRRAEDDRAKAAAAAEKAEREKTTACGGWKERVVGELEELADMKWADDLVEMARKNKEVIAAAVAAFSLGFFVSQKLFSRK